VLYLQWVKRTEHSTGCKAHFLLQKNKGILSVSLDLISHRSGAFLMPVTSQRMTIQSQSQTERKITLMDYGNFKEQFVEDVKEKLYEQGTEVDITVNTVNKLNESYEAMPVRL
jgi:hypothetical protein